MLYHADHRQGLVGHLVIPPGSNLWPSHLRAQSTFSTLAPPSYWWHHQTTLAPPWYYYTLAPPFWLIKSDLLWDQSVGWLTVLCELVIASKNLETALFKSFHHPRATFAYHWWQHLTTVLLPENKHEAKKGHRVIDLAGSCSKRLKYKKASCCLHAFSLCGVHWKCTGSVKRVPLASVFSEHLPSTGMSLFRNGRRQKTTLTH